MRWTLAAWTAPLRLLRPTSASWLLRAGSGSLERHDGGLRECPSFVEAAQIPYAWLSSKRAVCASSNRASTAHSFRGEPIARCPTAIARRATSTLRGSTCASSGPCSRPAARDTAAECVALRKRRPSGRESRAVVPRRGRARLDEAIATARSTVLAAVDGASDAYARPGRRRSAARFRSFVLGGGPRS